MLSNAIMGGLLNFLNDNVLCRVLVDFVWATRACLLCMLSSSSPQTCCHQPMQEEREFRRERSAAASSLTHNRRKQTSLQKHCERGNLHRKDKKRPLDSRRWSWRLPSARSPKAKAASKQERAILSLSFSLVAPSLPCPNCVLRFFCRCVYSFVA